MSDYSDSVVYKLGCKDTTVLEIYIGSTHDKNEREQKHKTRCNNENYEYYNLKVYEFIRANGGYDNWKFEVIEIFPCENYIQLRIRERYHYDKLKPALNMIRPYVSEEELKEENKEYKAKYYQDNKEEILIYNAKRYQDNKEEILIYNAKRYQDNKEEIHKRNNQKHNCECGGKYTTQNKVRHLDSNKHKKYIEKQHK